MPNMQQTMLLLELEAAGKKPSGPGQHEKCSCSHEGWQHSTSGKCNVIGCDCEQHDGGKKIKAGGPGSGRHSGVCRNCNRRFTQNQEGKIPGHKIGGEGKDSGDLCPGSLRSPKD